MNHRRRNIRFGFRPSQPTKAELRTSRREFKQRVRQKVREDREYLKKLHTSVRSSGPSYAKRKLEELFHEVYGQNPRQLPGVTDKELAAFQKLIEGKTIMATKKRRTKKKRNPRKGKMPAGLRKYWAKKRAAKAKRRNPRPRRRRKPVARRRKPAVRNYRKPARRKTARRRRANPPRKTSSRMNLGSGFTRTQINRVANYLRRATGKKVTIVKP